MGQWSKFVIICSRVRLPWKWNLVCGLPWVALLLSHLFPSGYQCVGTMHMEVVCMQFLPDCLLKQLNVRGWLTLKVIDVMEAPTKVPKEIKKLQLNFLLNGKDGIRPHSNVGLGIGLWKRSSTRILCYMGSSNINMFVGTVIGRRGDAWKLLYSHDSACWRWSKLREMVLLVRDGSIFSPEGEMVF